MKRALNTFSVEYSRAGYLNYKIMKSFGALCRIQWWCTCEQSDTNNYSDM